MSAQKLLLITFTLVLFTPKPARSQTNCQIPKKIGKGVYEYIGSSCPLSIPNTSISMVLRSLSDEGLDEARMIVSTVSAKTPMVWLKSGRLRLETSGDPVLVNWLNQQLTPIGKVLLRADSVSLITTAMQKGVIFTPPLQFPGFMPLSVLNELGKVVVLKDPLQVDYVQQNYRDQSSVTYAKPAVPESPKPRGVGCSVAESNHSSGGVLSALTVIIALFLMGFRRQ